jgi:lysophospholipase L1-like esterase
MKYLLLFGILIFSLMGYSQGSRSNNYSSMFERYNRFYSHYDAPLFRIFPSTDSLRNYNIKWITNNAAMAFSNLHLHYLLEGMIDWIDSARAGIGGSIGIDSISALNDSTIRYRKNGVYRQFQLRGKHWILQEILNHGSTLTSNSTITLADSLTFASGKIVVDNLRIAALEHQTDTTLYKPTASDINGNIVTFDSWPVTGTNIVNAGGSGDTLWNGSALKRFEAGLPLTISTNSNKLLLNIDSFNSTYGYVPQARLRDTAAAIDARQTLQRINGNGNTTTIPMYVKTSAPLTSQNIYWFGNSFTAGYGLQTTTEAFPAIVSTRLGLTEINNGVSASTLMKRTPVDPWGATNMIDRLNTIPTKTSADRYIVFFYGLNDLRWNTANYTAANFKIDYQRVIDTCFARGWTGPDIVLGAPFYVPDAAYYNDAVAQGWTQVTQARSLEFGDTVEVLSQLNGTKFVDGYTALYDNGRNLLFQTDSLHANHQGHIAIATAILEKLNVVQQQTQSFAVQGPTELDSVRINAPAQSDGAILPLVINNNGYMATSANGLIYNIKSLPNGVNSRIQGGNIAMSGKIAAGGRNWLGETDNLLVQGSALADTMNSHVFGTKESGNINFIRDNQLSMQFSATHRISMGYLASATADYTLSAGYLAQANGPHSISLGPLGQANGGNSFAIDAGIANGQFSTGMHSGKADGQYAFGYNSMSHASANNSIAWGQQDTAAGNSSAAIGLNVVSRAFAEFSFGVYNDSTIAGDPNNWAGTDNLFVIGNGQGVGKRNNALTILKNGNAYLDSSWYYENSKVPTTTTDADSNMIMARKHVLNVMGGQRKIYKALISQSGTSDPTATILGVNSIGTIVWTRNSAGDYTGTLSGAFTASKTWLEVSSANISLSRINSNEVNLTTSGDNFTDISIGIEVYP